MQYNTSPIILMAWWPRLDQGSDHRACGAPT